MKVEVELLCITALVYRLIYILIYIGSVIGILKCNIQEGMKAVP